MTDPPPADAAPRGGVAGDRGRGWRRGPGAGVTLALAAGLVAHLTIARRLPIDFYDGFDYLLNARLFAGRGTWFEGVRPPLVSLLQAPLQGGPLDSGWAGAHVLAVVLAYASLVAVGAWLRRGLGPATAWIGLAMVAGCRLFVHYAPFVMADLLGMGCVALALWGFQVAREPARRAGDEGAATGPGWAWWVAGAGGSLALLARHPHGIVGPFLVGFEVYESLRRRSPTATLRRPGLWLAAAAPTLAFLAVMVLILSGSLGWSAGDALRGVAHIVGSQAAGSGITRATSESPFEYLAALRAQFGAGVLLAMLAGAVRGVLSSRSSDRLHALWFVGNLALYSLLVQRRESRYFLAAVPSGVLLALRLVEEGARWLRARHAGGEGARGLEALAATAVGLAIAAPLIGGLVAERRAFADAVYREPFAAEVARCVSELVPEGGRVEVRGDKYALRPEDPLFTPGDEYYYYHHLTWRSFDYFLDVPVEVAGGNHAAASASPGEGASGPGVVAITLEPRTYHTRIPARVKIPLRVTAPAAGVRAAFCPPRGSRPGRVWVERGAPFAAGGGGPGSDPPGPVDCEAVDPPAATTIRAGGACGGAGAGPGARRASRDRPQASSPPGLRTWGRSPSAIILPR